MWKLWTDLEIWWLDLQLSGFEPSLLWLIVLLLICIVIGYLGLQIVIWQNRVGFLSQILASASFVFPPPVVRLRVVLFSALIVAALWYLLK